MNSAEHIRLVETYGARNYHPLEVVVATAEGPWVTDVDGKRYLDMLSAYSAVNFGHNNPKLIKAAEEQLRRLTLTSRAFHNDQLGPWCQAIVGLCDMEMVLPMNTGAEGVETAIKTARRWGYQTKGIAADQAEIICCEGNFHGRTTTIVGFSTDPNCRKDFGPFTPGFKLVPYGDVGALEEAITPNTAGFLVEPIQGEGGIIIPPDGYLKDAFELCRKHNVLFIADEIQTGLCRTGKIFACQHENVQPDIFILGKALGGGIMPISAVVSRKDILGLFTPGCHGSTFGGNPLACAISRRVIQLIEEEKPHERAAELGDYVIDRIRSMNSPIIEEVRGRGLFVGIQIKKDAGKAMDYCYKLKESGVLCKDTHEQVMRLAPPLVIEKSELDWALERLETVLCSGAVHA